MFRSVGPPPQLMRGFKSYNGREPETAVLVKASSRMSSRLVVDAFASLDQVRSKQNSISTRNARFFDRSWIHMDIVALPTDYPMCESAIDEDSDHKVIFFPP